MKSFARGRPATEPERAEMRKSICSHYGIDPTTDKPLREWGVRYIRSTETWYCECSRCLMWVRDGHAAMEVNVAKWIDRWAEQSGADEASVREALDDSLTSLREVFVVADLDDLEAELAAEELFYGFDDEPDHKGRCEPVVFKSLIYQGT